MAEYGYSQKAEPQHLPIGQVALDDPEKQKIKKYKYRQDRMEKKRINHENIWQDLYDFIIPRKGDVISSHMEGDKRGHDLFDSTAPNSNILMAGMLHGMLTNPTTQFFDFIMGDDRLDSLRSVRAWLQDASSICFKIIQGSNFQTEVAEIYLDQGAIGNACLFIGEHDERVVHFNARAMKEIFAEENNLGVVDIIHRKFKWKPRQIIQEFGEKGVPGFVLEEYAKGCDDEWTILHVVQPKDDKKESLDGYTSCYLLPEQEVIISEKSFREFPYAAPRWSKTSGETYGRGPGHDALPDIQMVNSMMETVIAGAQKTVDPPMMVMNNSVIGRVRLSSGGLTYVKPSNDKPIQPLIVDARIDFGYQAVEDVRKRIRAAFFIDQMQMQQGGPMKTATEVMQIRDEQLRLMGPILGRQHFEFLRPMLHRVFGIAARRGLIPPAPAEIQGRLFDVRYSSLIARVQRADEAQNVMRALNLIAPVAQFAPQVLDNVDPDKYYEYITDQLGVTHKINRDGSEKKKIRTERAKAQAEQQQMMRDQAQADNAGKIMPGAAQMQTAKNKEKEVG